MPAVIDLTGQNPISESYVIDPNTNALTLTISSSTGSLGQMVFDKVRFRAFAESLAELAKSVSKDTDTRQKSRMMYDVKSRTSKVTFG